MSPRSADSDVGPHQNGAPLIGSRVLLAEDEPLTRRVYAAALAKAGADVVSVADGAGVVAAWKASEAEGRPFQFAILDYAMPVLDGAEAALALSAGGFSGRVVGLTAGVGPDEARRWRENGCALIFPKSIGPAGFVARLVAANPPRQEPRSAAG